MKKLCVIVCNNGRGHIKRVLWILNGLLKTTDSLAVDVFASHKKIEAFATIVNEIKQSGAQVQFHDIDADVFNYEDTFIAQYKDFLDQADYIWSDNLVFPLKYHPQVFLTGQFLWLDVINDDDFAEKEKETLKNHRPRMLGMNRFVTPNVEGLTNFTGVGVYQYFSDVDKAKKNKSILIACGATESANTYFKAEINSIAAKVSAAPKSIIFFVEPSFLEHFPKQDNIKEATFDKEMFEQIKAAVIRPGMGTICDCLSTYTKIFAFSEGANFELEHNMRVLENLGLGDSSGGVVQAIDKAITYVNDLDAQDQYVSNTQKMNYNGLEEIINHIKTIVEVNNVCA